MLTEYQTIEYLLERGLIAPESIVNDRIKVTNLARRNQNFQITGLSDRNYFLKQGRYEMNIGSVTNEAAIYQVLQASCLNLKLSRYLPQCFGYDAQSGILLLEAIYNAQDLQQYHTTKGRFPKSIAREIGTALGLLHNTIQHQPQGNQVDIPIQPVLPTVFCLSCPPLEILQGASGVCIELMKMLQQYRIFKEEFEKLVEEWRTESIIHGDIKLANFLTYKKPSSVKTRGIKLIDWEFAGIGDPRWDVGSVFSSYLTLWLFSVPISQHDQAAQFLHLAQLPLVRIQPAITHLAQLPLVRIQPAITHFWKSYCHTRQLNESKQLEWLLHALRFAAACLIQTAYEFAKGSNYLTAEIVLLTQLSLNIFQRPEQAAVQLLGLSL